MPFTSPGIWYETDQARRPLNLAGDCVKMFDQAFVGDATATVKTNGWRECLQQLRKYNPSGVATYKEGTCHLFAGGDDAVTHGRSGSVALRPEYVVSQCTTCLPEPISVANVGCVFTPESCQEYDHLTGSGVGRIASGYPITDRSFPLSVGDVCPGVVLSISDTVCQLDWPFDDLFAACQVIGLRPPAGPPSTSTAYTGTGDIPTPPPEPSTTIAYTGTGDLSTAPTGTTSTFAGDITKPSSSSSSSTAAPEGTEGEYNTEAESTLPEEVQEPSRTTALIVVGATAGALLVGSAAAMTYYAMTGNDDDEDDFEAQYAEADRSEGGPPDDEASSEVVGPEDDSGWSLPPIEGGRR